MRVRLRQAYTMIEALIVISIVCLLATLLFPVLQSAKFRVKQSRSVQQMRQIHLAVVMYCDEQSEAGPLGLGLPPDIISLKRARNLPDALFVTGGSSWKSPSQRPVYTWMPPALHADQPYLLPLWKAYVQEADQNPVILIDETFNRQFARFAIKQATGIFYDGSLATRHSRGSLSRYDLWILND